MTLSLRPWPTRGYLDALRPDPETEVELALLAAYSADPVSIVAALLALIARDDEDRPASRRDLADAVEALRGRVRVIVQRGRIARMRRTPRLTGLLDQFVREVGFDERLRSWHPKAALVKLQGSRGPEWRLWIGSRNLTAPENRDLGLLLVGSTRGRGRKIPGVEDLAAALAARAELDGVSAAKLAREALQVRWRTPAGVKVDRLRISRGESEWPLPELPKQVDALTVVSPFLDTRFLGHAARPACPEGSRILLSSVAEIERLAAACAAFGELFALDAPDYPATASDGNDALENSDPAEGEGEELGQGLHAKLLHYRKGEQRRVWIGSANATSRAWTGRNVEIVAELSVDRTVEEGLLQLLGRARPVTLGPQETLENADPEHDRLEQARLEVTARWNGEILWDDAGLRLRHVGDPHPDDPEIGLEAGLVNSDLLCWSRGQAELALGTVDKADRTEFVQLRLTLHDRSCVWIVQAPATPPFGVERDRAAFMRLMGAREFLMWIADLLRGATFDVDGPSWLDETSRRDHAEPAAVNWTDGLPTLEEMLAAWAREPACFERVQARIRQYLVPLLEQTKATDPEGHAQLAKFQELWATVEEGLGSIR